jgi:hypothetical protein
MNKLKTQKFNNLLNYQHFLKNNSLKKKRFKLKNILFENQVLYKNKDLKIIELENSENIEIPITVLDFNNINTIQASYKNQLLFNYNLNYHILYNFNKIIFNYILKQKKNTIKGRVMTGNYKKIIIAFLGATFSMKPINLNNSISNKNNFYGRYYNKKKNFIKNNYKKKIHSKYYNKKKKIFKNNYKKKIKHKNFFFYHRNKRINRIILSYKLRYLNFKMEKNKKKIFFSRIAYLEDIIKYLRIKNQKKRMLQERKKQLKKKNLSRKGYVKTKQNKTK